MAITDDFQTLAKKLRDPLRAWFVSGPPEAWHEVGAAGEPAFQNSWVNYGGGTDPAGFYKDPLGRVWLRGLISGGTATDGTVIFQLPAGYRPSSSPTLVTVSNSTPCWVQVVSSGNVAIYNASSAWLRLDGVGFRAA